MHSGENASLFLKERFVDMVSAELAEVLDFGPFRLHPRNRKLFCGAEEVHIGGRSMDVLLALARTQGELVSKEQLFAAAWPNTFVHESNLKVAIASLRRTLREYSPSLEFITTVVGRGYRLAFESQSADPSIESEFPMAAGTSLPELGTVIGRDAEIALLRETLARNRLTTIVGAGGIGKTTVAIAVAHLFEDEGGGSVTFVDLARVSSEEFVPASLASALGISANSNDALQAVVSILSRRKSLLLLDTCEHVLSAVTHVCDFVLAKTTDVRILATSRQVLRARYEKLVWLDPLKVPPPEHADTAADVLKYSAPQLLVARASEKAGYCIDDKDARAITEICRRLDGAPLSIELVSSRLKARSANTVLEELDDRFRSLRKEAPGGPLRQQTLLVTLEWSYALLNEDEARTLRAISIFAGSFDADSVAHVVAHSGETSFSAFDAIAALRAKSMISEDHSTGKLRHRLLDSTRAFASTLLEGHGEVAAVSTRHARLQLEILTRAGEEHASLSARAWHARYGGQVDDLRKALDWALYQSADTLLGMQLVAAGLPLWHELSLGEESRENCRQALAEFERTGCTDTALKLNLIVGLATGNTYLSGDPDETIALYKMAIRLARETGKPGIECRSLGALALYTLLPGNQSGVSETLGSMRRAAIEANDRAALWEQDHLVAEWEAVRGDFQASRKRLQKLCIEMREYSEGAAPRFQIRQKSAIEVHLGAINWFMGAPGEALRLVEKAAVEAIEFGHGLTIIHCLAHGIIFTLNECRLYSKAKTYTELLKSTIYRHGMAEWIPIADCYTLAIPALSGEGANAHELRAAVGNLRKGMIQVGHHSYYATLAHAMVEIGQYEDAARTVELVLEADPQRWVLPELLRLRAATERAFKYDEKAEITLRESLESADSIGALGWKLRSAFDLSTLLNDHGKSHEAKQLLRSVYDRFSDGSDTGDLMNCRMLLKQLS
ncbi:putative ATPase/DNA-binding winged helix-turn-helix (wHTH) protein [Bradyrhizobium japonicum]|uniref:ATP-binding protein n=1 Tax=Bradyrhizobium japonicum TaxID=375 RepID=UPI002168C354|nr:winged helix-turn-helix domain-containing protein [Bradyrhizobium japonicum]MCS3498678.1 putative ATPase/DNA-binding winged helix-turn-helix (wHTH) protein [Bradyrhizobium japonicum]MCS3959160.1 putative ATPase/DNA-binding winged helix-turn-helix (wHTH) protein [Bradyrhizobium japonicum]MCS4000915.1 putative ATPase/DNA-binding winged helix-turn-helix (wHTH) protein [Bradyrhizobium japonicum]